MALTEDEKKGLSAALAGTRAVGPDGRPLLLCHATNKPFERFSVTSDLGYHFGSHSQAGKRMANMVSRGEAEEGDPWRIVTCALRVTNPLVIADDPGVWNPRWMTATLCVFLDDGDRCRIRHFAAELDSRVPDSPITPCEREAISEWFSVLVGALKRAGHDGIVYRNLFESTGRAIEWSWLVFDDSQIVRIDPASAQALDEVEAGEPLKLRGAGPMRHHQPRGVGPFAREREKTDFRRAVEDWAQEAGVEWSKVYPPGYEPSFGEMRPSHELQAKVGEDEGYRIKVSVTHGTVLLQPFSDSETSGEMMKRFMSDASEGFFEQGVNSSDSEESVIWRPAETLQAFRARLEAVHRDFAETFSGPAPAGPGRR